MITPSFSLTATERVLPKLALDFTTGLLDNRVTFTRTTDATHPATYTNSSGVITAATNNQARFDYNPVTLACKGLLIEESRANLFLQSADLSTSWTKANGTPTITTDQATAPDGTLSADLFIPNTNTNFQLVYQSPTAAAGTYTCSIYGKKKDYDYLAIGCNSPSLAFSYFNLSTGQVTGAGSGHTASIVDAGGGWYRCIVTVTTTGVNSTFYTGISSTAFSVQTAGNGTSGSYMWGAQLEAGAFATSYIPTTTTALTRNADVATMTGTNFSSWYNQSEGAFEIDANYKGFVINEMLLTVTDGALGAYMQSYWPSSTSIQLDAKAGSGQIVITSAINTDIKYLFAYKDNSYAAAVSGNAVSTSSTLKSSTGVTQLNIGHRNGSLPANAWFKKIMYWPQRLINNEVRAFSK